MKNTINKYFEVKVKLQKTMEDGQQKKVSEQYVASEKQSVVLPSA